MNTGKILESVTKAVRGIQKHLFNYGIDCTFNEACMLSHYLHTCGASLEDINLSLCIDASGVIDMVRWEE